MAVILDVITVLVYIIVIYHAYKRGLLRAVINVVGFIASFVISFLFCQPLGNWIDSAFLNKFVHGSLSQLNSSQSGASSAAFFQQLISTMPAAMSKSLQDATPQLKSIGQKTAASVIDAVSAPLSSVLSRGIAFFVILALCLVLVGFLARISDAVVHIPILGKLNSIGGAVVGIFEAMIVMLIISTLLSLVISLMAIQKNPPITNSTVNSTYIYKYVHNINPLTGMLLKL